LQQWFNVRAPPLRQTLAGCMSCCSSVYSTGTLRTLCAVHSNSRCWISNNRHKKHSVQRIAETP